jgi:hypothetical protein
VGGALRIPDAAGAYRGIRANMEQTSVALVLDQYAMARGARLREARYGEAVAIVGKGTGARYDAPCQVPPKSGESGRYGS